MNNCYFHLFANCVPVKGASRSIICDLQRNAFDFIPNDLLEVLDLTKSDSYDEILKKYGEENKIALQEYFDFLISKDYGFWGSLKDQLSFPDLDLNWKTPFEITTAIIDFSAVSEHKISLILDQLEELGCVDLQIRIFDKISLEHLKEILAEVQLRRVKSIQLLVPFNSEIYEDDYIELCRNHLRIATLQIHSSPFTKKLDHLDNITYIEYVKQDVKDETHCGIISSSFFSINIDLFSEAQSHNTCLNKKISISKEGEIKNCPSMTKSYGNISKVQLLDVLKLDEFKSVWQISKDDIHSCQDCEFRYICTDCRAYLEEPDNQYSKPLKCGYNPYTSRWEEWSMNPLKQQARKFYKAQEELDNGLHKVKF